MATMTMQTFPILTACMGAAGSSPLNGGVLLGYSTLLNDSVTPLEREVFPNCTLQLNLINSTSWELTDVDPKLVITLTETQLAGFPSGVNKADISLTYAGLEDGVTYTAIVKLTVTYPSGATDTDTGLIEIFKAVGTNECPSTSNNEITLSNGQLYTFSIADFPYSDPESDVLADIKINTLPSCGTLVLGGSGGVPSQDITVGQIITVANITDGRFLFLSPSQDTESTCVFSFSVRAATGCVTWVS
jgi:hypothetical protein